MQLVLVSFRITLRFFIIFLIFFPLLNYAGISPTWTGNTNSNWGDKDNWSGPKNAPGSNGSPFDDAIFGKTNKGKSINCSNAIILNNLQYNADASEYSIRNNDTFTLTGKGIINNSAKKQEIINAKNLIFSNNADAGSNMLITNNGGGLIKFKDNATANQTKIVNNGSADVDLSELSSSAITIGSLAGDGKIKLGSKELKVGILNEDATISGIISGDKGKLTKQGNGTLILTGENTYTGDTTISSGTLQIGNTGKGSISGNILNNSELIFKRSSNYTYEGTISGSGSVTKSGNGTLTLTADSPCTGNTTVSDGTLQFGDGGTSGSLAGNIIDNSTVIFNRSNNIIYDLTITGTGNLKKLGTGILTLNNVNQYTGYTQIDNGTLRLGDRNHRTASVKGNVNINSQGTLGGYGIVQGNVVNNGNISPGASLGTLYISGNYTQSPSANYLVEVDSQGSSDLIAISGNAFLNGTITIDTTAGFTPSYKYTILTANQINGHFSNTDASGYFTQGFTQGQVFYLSNAVQLALNINSPLVKQVSQTPNEKAVVNNILQTGGTSAIQTLLNSLTTIQQFRSAMDQISAATYANQHLELAYLGNWFSDQLSDRYSAFPTSENRCTLKQESFCGVSPFWIAAYGSHDKLSGSEVSGLLTTPKGLALGFEWPTSKKSGIGMGVGFTDFHSDATIKEIASTSGNLFQLGLYGHYQLGPVLLGGSVDFGRTAKINTTRQITAFTSPYLINANYSANLYSQQIRALYDLKLSLPIFIRPFIGVINQQINRDRIREEGSAGFLLNILSNSYRSTRTQLGILIESPDYLLLQPFASLSWEHECADVNGQFDANLVGVNQGFAITGTEVARNAALVKTGILYQQDKWFISAFYEGRFARAFQQNGVKGQVSIRYAIW